MTILQAQFRAEVQNSPLLASPLYLPMLQPAVGADVLLLLTLVNPVSLLQNKSFCLGTFDNRVEILLLFCIVYFASPGNIDATMKA